MRFLLDNNLSRSWPNFSAAQGRVLISADTDFGTLLARTHATAPSFLLLRRARGRRASEQAAIILSNLDTVRADLDAGAIVVLGEATLRIRRLPSGPPGQGG
jgi:predicted nuclease of predicted toxin-antitoxin system